MTYKKKNTSKKTINNDTIIEDKPIITHLPINLYENKIFNENKKDIIIENLEKKINILMKEIDKGNKTYKLYNINNNNNENNNNNNNINCWWCRHKFSTPTVSLPENIYNDKFSTFGIFCSYNCAMAYNINLNDENIYKRTSLLNYLYKRTYNKFVDIIQAPSWKILENYGGLVSIETFRESFIFNDFEYNYIKPPIISCIYQIEKKFKKSTIKSENSNNYVLKRKKPINNSKYTLENTMGLKKIINSSD